MDQKRKNAGSFTQVGFWRLMPFVKPYWVRLMIGLLAGLVVGGSLFGSIMILPNMLVIADHGKQSKTLTKSQEITAALTEAGELTAEEETELINHVLQGEPDSDPQLTKSLDTLRKYSGKFHLPMEVGKQDITITWPTNYHFVIVDEQGRMTWEFFSVYAILFILAWGLKNLATYINHYYMRWVSSRAIADMRNVLFDKILSQSMRFFGHQDTGNLIARCTNDPNIIESSITDVISDLTRCPIEIAACLVAMVVVCMQQHMWGMLFAALCVPVCLTPVVIFARKIRQNYREVYGHVSTLTSRMHETFTGILLVKTSHTEGLENSKFREINTNYFNTLIKALCMKLLMSPLMEFTAVTVTLFFAVFAYRRGFTISQMITLLAPAALAYQPLKTLTKVINNLQRSMAAADRYFDLIETDTSLVEKENPVELTEFKQGIEFRDVSFAYEPGHNVLKHISFELPIGKMVAVVGETGSGKSTIASLIARLYDTTEGEVLIDGVPVQDYSITSLRSKIGVVTQEPIIFNDTIANNIAYGTRSDVTRDEIIDAAKNANAHEFIVSDAHPQGYEEEAGEKGFHLSGGEKQRIALARIMLKNPPILILDEATSALDTVTEKIIQNSLAQVMKNRTVFAIAHRLSTIRNADLILVIDHGEIAERGTHAELLAQGGIYRKLHDTQFTMD